MKRLTHHFHFRFILPGLFVLLLSACSFSLAEDIPPPEGFQPTAPQAQIQVSGPVYPVVPPNPAEGAPIFLEKCAPCHGETGLGNGPSASQLSVPVPALGTPDLARQATPAQWFSIVTNGNMERFMPPFTSLTDRQRWDVVAYALSLSISPDQILKGQEIYQSKCMNCHGESGQGDGPDSVGLAVTPGDFTNQESMAEKSAYDFFQIVTDGTTNMLPFGDSISEADRWAVVDYLRSLSFSTTAEQAATGTEPTPQQRAPGTGSDSSSNTENTNATPESLASNLRQGTITVQLNNQSGSQVPDDLPVTLFGFDNMTMVFSQTISTGLDGEYVFSDVDLPDQRAFLASVDYQGTTYGSDVGVVTPDSTDITLPIRIFETTTDTSKLVADRMHIFFDFSQSGTVQVVELYIISNPTDQTVVSAEEGGPVLSFDLPQGASNLEFQDGTLGDRFIQTPAGFADTMSVRPSNGEYQVLFAFDLPYDRKLSFDQPLVLPVNAVTVMVPEVGVKMKSDQFQAGDIRDVQGIQFRMYTAGQINAGSAVTLELSGNPKQTSTSLVTGSDNRTNLLIGVGTLGLVLIVIGIWVWNRQRNRADTSDELQDETENETDALVDSDTIMDAIIALDDLYQAGELPEEAYQQRRGKLKGRLKELMDDRPAS